MRVVIADDSSVMRRIVIRTLRQAGFDDWDITEASDGAELVALVRSGNPDLVLSDWNMPNMTGLQLLEALTEEGIKLTFGFVTTEVTPEMRVKATAAGAKFLIAKPFTPESFKEQLGSHIR